ncbi:AMP nucleosidase [Lutibaculum baratangense]|uniref:AMP nucleosidase n=1 Tax=Lutibaculum baratangense AMV1 TaxID=631454 RepID=V4R8Z5_9HYPH|nr:AMP nucleosidase [Lutibaculum baratangense]ESR22666.1 AMP nucleosidase [Lutibaculum baratangense AMV1]
MQTIIQPDPIETEEFRDAESALRRIEEIYERNTAFLREQFRAYLSGRAPSSRVRAAYPFVRIATRSHARVDSRLSYGFVAHPGVHETTVTRPDVFRDYYLEQISLLIDNHGVPVEVGESDEPIPIHFAFVRDINSETADAQRQAGEGEPERPLRDVFDVPDLASMDDAIVNGTLDLAPGAPEPLALFRAGRVDYSLHRLLHYTGTQPSQFQNFVIFTNYQFYVDAFVRIGRARVASGDPGCVAFVEPGGVETRLDADGRLQTSGEAPERMPQMPAYHLVCGGSSGITMINIGAGPSNARTMTDHVAVLRPHAWLMLGHCAGLRNTQKLGDYVLAHGYVREDHVLDEDLPTSVPVPALAEVQVALERAVAEVTELDGYALKSVMRTGTVASVDNRNWELGDHRAVIRRLSQSRAVALDMESAVIAANGFRCRVPYGTLLCVSDKPLHGEIKLAGMAGAFYRQRVEQHLQIGLRAIELLQEQERGRLHSRKLRSFTEVAFQ